MSNHKSYTIGFVASIALTLTAYFIASNNFVAGSRLVAIVISLAFIQALIQLIFFLHLGQEEKPKWNFLVFLSTVSVIFIVLGGSIWIMNNLNYRHGHSDQELNDYIFEQEAIPK